MAMASVVGISPTTVGVQQAGAVSTESTCTEVSGSTTTTWRVTYDTVVTAYGTGSKVTALHQRVNSGSWTDVSGQTWELRYDVNPQDWPAAGWSPPTTNPPPFFSVTGAWTAAGIGRTVMLYSSPRLVVPDGSCTVYIYPYSWGSGPAPKIAVLGDDLLHQLNDLTVNVGAVQGLVETTFAKLNIRPEVEGQGVGPNAGQLGRRWTAAAGTTDLAKADSYLLDEFRGLLEHDTDGFVVGLGRNDAMYVAQGADQATRDARWTEVYDKLLPTIAEMTGRGGCVTAVTAPDNATSLNANYATYANQINDFIRYTAFGQEFDSWNYVDFGQDARQHKATDAVPWFNSDNLNLNAAGRAAYNAAIAKAAQICADSVVLWGAPGTLGKGSDAGQTKLPTGQDYNVRSSVNVDFEAGKAPWMGTVAADGTLFSPTVSNNGAPGVTPKIVGEGLTVSALNPDSGTFENIKIKTDRGKEVPVTPDNWRPPADADSAPDKVAADIGDVEAINGGSAVAFTVDLPNSRQPLDDCGTEDTACGGLTAQGQFPTLGVLTKNTNGQWRIAEGADGPDADTLPDWRNSWSPRELVAATIAADPVNGQALANQVCANWEWAWFHLSADGLEYSNCDMANEIAVLPSGDLAVTHYYGGVSVIDLSAPDPSGRITARIAATYVFDPIDDPSWPRDGFEEPDPYLDSCPAVAWDQPTPVAEVDRKITIGPREVQADPTSPTSDQRFALESDTWAYRYVAGTPNCVKPTVIDGPLMEFSYNPSGAWNADPAQNQRLRPVSAPIYTGEVPTTTEPKTGLKSFTGNGQFLYDWKGNLWIDSFVGVKVFTKKANGRSLAAAPCVQANTLIQNYRIDLAEVATAGTREMWGTICPADYLLPQPKEMGGGLAGLWGLEEDPVTHDIVTYTWPRGSPIAIRADDPGADGLALNFKIGNFAGLSAQQLDTSQFQGPCKSNPANTCSTDRILNAMIGAVDKAGRTWIVVNQATNQGSASLVDPLHPQVLAADHDQWFYSVSVSRLLGREPQRLSALPGTTTATVVQGEQTQTMTSTSTAMAQTDPLRVADWRVDAHEGLADCPSASCNDGEATPGRTGYSLSAGAIDFTGIPSTKTLSYTVVVPKGGTYQLRYRAADVQNTGSDAQIVMTVDGGTPRAAVTLPNGPGMEEVTDANSLSLTAGTHTIVLSASSTDRAGWQLDWMRFTRQ